MRFSAWAKRASALAVLVLGSVAFVPAAPPAQAATPAHTDVMFVFDTTGSMSTAINAAKAEIQEAMSQIGASLPDAQFGLIEVSDYNEVVNPGAFEYGIGGGHPAWTLHVPITADQSLVNAEIQKLFASGGGDGPEAYGRALFEAAANSAVGWRSGARGVIVLVADNVPHDNDLNDGIPAEVQAFPSPFDTGIDPGADNAVGTGDDLDWQNVVLQRLLVDGKPLEYVDYFGEPEFFPYWQNWAGRTGGSAVEAGGASLSSSIVELVKAGASASLPACPAGQVRDSNDHCVTATPPPPPSNSFKIEPRISCSKGCHVVLVKITFDSAGNVTGESVLEEDEAHGSALASATQSKKGKGKAKACGRKGGCKPKPLIKPFSQAVTAGVNTVQLKLTGPAIKTLNKKGKLKLKVKLNFTPTGGTLKSTVQTFSVKLPKPKPKKHRKRGH